MGEGGRKKMRVLLLALGLSALCLVAHGASPDHEFNEVDQMREVDEVIPQDPMRDDNDTSEPITTKIGLSNQDLRYVNGRPVTSNELDRPVKLSSSSSVTQQAGYLAAPKILAIKDPIRDPIRAAERKAAAKKAAGEKAAPEKKPAAEKKKAAAEKKPAAEKKAAPERRGGQRHKGKGRNKMAESVKRQVEKQVKAVMQKTGDANLPLNKLAKAKTKLARKAAERVKEARKAARKYLVAGKKAYHEAVKEAKKKAAAEKAERRKKKAYVRAAKDAKKKLYDERKLKRAEKAASEAKTEMYKTFSKNGNVKGVRKKEEKEEK